MHAVHGVASPDTDLATPEHHPQQMKLKVENSCPGLPRVPLAMVTKQLTSLLDSILMLYYGHPVFSESGLPTYLLKNFILNFQCTFNRLSAPVPLKFLNTNMCRHEAS